MGEAWDRGYIRRYHMYLHLTNNLWRSSYVSCKFTLSAFAVHVDSRDNRIAR